MISSRAVSHVNRLKTSNVVFNEGNVNQIMWTDIVCETLVADTAGIPERP
jgi:hypothetical protein